MNREVIRQIRVTTPAKRKLDRQVYQLQVDLGRQITFSEMLDAMLEQTVYEHLLAELRKRHTEGGQS